MSMKLMQFEDITQEQWDTFLHIYLNTMGEDIKLSHGEKVSLDDGLKELVKKRGVSDINKFKFEWDTDLNNFVCEGNAILGIQAAFNSRHRYTFYMDQSRKLGETGRNKK